MRTEASASGAEGVAAALRPIIVLVVDDSPSQRKMLALLLRRWNFDVIEAADGASALAVCKARPVDFVISDWMMPEMTGPELCRAIRKLRCDHYHYFILLTSKSAKEDIATGLDAGADDFLSKPMDPGEMQARLRAGQRILSMQEDLVDKNRRITEALDTLTNLYDDIERDLRAAAQLQKSLIPPRQSHCGGVEIGVLYRPAGHVGGDLVGFFQVSDHRICAYSIDVSGHGVSSALLTVRLANFFSPDHLDENIAVQDIGCGQCAPRDPAEISAGLNERLQDEADTDQYFTMLFADINTATGAVRFCQAGHPSPAILRHSGGIEFAGTGGAPIGLVPGMDYTTEAVHLSPGDKMLLFSDGITECMDPGGAMLEAAGLARLLGRVSSGTGDAEILNRLMDRVTEFAGGAAFEDDVSALLLTMPDQADRGNVRAAK